MAHKQLPTISYLYKSQVPVRLPIIFRKHRPEICSSKSIYVLPSRLRLLTTAEPKPESANEGEAAVIFDVPEVVLNTIESKSIVRKSIVEKKAISKLREILANDQVQELKAVETSLDSTQVCNSRSSKKSKSKLRSTKKAVAKIKSNGGKFKDKIDSSSVTKIRRTRSEEKASLPKASLDSELKRISDATELPVDWKKSLFNILKNVKASDASEQAVLKIMSSKLGSSFEVSARKDEELLLWKLNDSEIKTLDGSGLSLVPLHDDNLKVPRLSYGLDRVLFNHGVYQLQDPRTRVFNFDPYLREIMPVSQFDFGALSQYITSSSDNHLLAKAAEEKKKYVGSTSSMSNTLSHFHFLLSNWRPIEYGNLSGLLPSKLKVCDYTSFTRAPAAIFLRYRNGSYAIDADKEYDDSNILAMLGKSMEKLLTLPSERFERYRRVNSGQISEEERNARESYHYTTFGDFLLRSQLDAFDPRLPGTGMFDLKTRCVISVRMDVSEYQSSNTYEIRKSKGEWESYEREYYDMIRAAFLKYSMQVRMGRMDGIFVAFHNTARIFGFQYISLEEMDYAIHGTEDLTTGNEEFKLSLSLLNEVFDNATSKFPKKTLRFLFDTQKPDKGELTNMKIIAQPLEEEEVEAIQAQAKERIESFERKILGIENTESDLEGAEKVSGYGVDKDEDRSESISFEPNLDGVEYYPDRSSFNTILMEQRIAEDMIEGEVIDEDAALEEQVNTDVHEEIVMREGNNGRFTGVNGREDNSTNKSLGADSSPLDGDGKVRNEASRDEWLTRPFLAMKLTSRNKVNGNYVERPENLSKDDQWSIEYRLNEYPEGKPAISVYRELRTRRRTVHTGGLDMNPNKPPSNLLVRELRKYIEKGRKFREQENEIEAKLPIQVVGT